MEPSPPPPLPSQHETLAGGGEMGERIRAFDWASTPLGPIERWSQSLKTALSLILNAQMPMWLGWTSEMYFFYNDAYVQVLSHAKHPWALGRPAQEVWKEIWHVCGPLAARVFDRGEAPFVEDVRLFMDRGDEFFEEVYYSFSYSPIRDESGQIAGLFCPNTEVTAKLLNARRMRTLAELSERALVEKTIEAACASAAATISQNPDDVPFALIYLAPANGAGELELREAVNIDPAPHAKRRWHVDEVFASGRAEHIELARGAGGDGGAGGERDAALPRGLADRPIREAIALPITSSGQTALGVLVAGVSSVRRLDVEYGTFFELMAGQIAVAVQNAIAAEETKRRADMLAEIDRAKTVFFSNVSHEFRTPLTLMIGPTEDALASAERSLHGEALETVYRNELRLLKLVNALLDFSRIEAGRMSATYEAIDLAALTADLASGFRAAIERAGLAFEVETPALPHLVAVDRDMWENIVLNLLSNALKFTLEGRIRIALVQRAEANEIELVVSDTGTGVPPEHLPRLFERFHRVENPHARTHEGTGIGLALVQELTKLHDGHVTVESEVGRGSTFRVTIPMRRAADAGVTPTATRPSGRIAAALEVDRWTAAQSPSQQDKQDVERVLLADDNADMRDYLQRLLAEHWNVTAVADGQAALDEARRAPPDLVLSDVMMPGLDGFGLLAALRANPATAAVPVLLVSARAGEEARVEGLTAGADDYLVKPFSARELVARVKTHLALGRARKASEETSAELYRMLQQVPAAITVRRGPELRCVFQNATSIAMFDQRGRALNEMWTGGETTGLAQFQRVMESGTTIVEREVAVTRAWDGREVSTRYFEITWTPWRLPDNTIDGVMTVSHDVTEGVMARHRAETSEQRRRLAIDAADVGIWHVDLVTKLATRDGAMNRILGLPEIETVQPLEDYVSRIHVDDRDNVLGVMDNAVVSGEPYAMELRIVRPDGAVRWLRDVGRVLYDDQRRAVAFTGAAADITDRKHAELRSDLAFKRLGAALAASEIGTYLLELRTGEWSFDDGIRRLFELPKTLPATSAIVEARVHPDDVAMRTRSFERCIREGVDLALEYRVVTTTGAERWLLDKGRRLSDPSGPTYVVGAVVDITEQKQLAEAALAGSRAKDEFLAMLGHELRNPLAPIVTALDVMRMRGDPATRERLMIERQVNHLTRLVDDLLDISRVTRGLIELERERVSIREVVMKAIEIASPLIEQKGHHVDVALPKDLWVDGDPVRLAQIFANLMTNAARYTKPAGKLGITAQRDGARIRVEVSDNGIGIPAEMLGPIFDLFVQGGRSAARSEGGLGIGLALVKNLVRLHGGEVSVKSEGVGKGSTFAIELPALEKQREAAAPRITTVREVSGLKVLVVDDNVDAAELLGDALRTFGHEVQVAHDGPQALQVLDRFRPDAAVLDIGLPVMDGYELAQRLRERGLAGCRLIALTGYGQKEDVDRSRQAGFDEHFTKPVDLHHLVKSLGVMAQTSS